jgi:hypothetical protein
MRAEGKFREHWPNVKPAGRSIANPGGDIGSGPLDPIDIPQTPVGLRKYRRTNMGPGEMHVHWGLKDQKLPSEEHRFGAPGVSGMTTESTMKAGSLVGVAEYKNGVGERVYASNKRKPLGNSLVRGHEVSVPDKGFGKKEYDVADARIFPASRGVRSRRSCRRRPTRTRSFSPSSWMASTALRWSQTRGC